MNKVPKISIIMTAYNASRTIGEAIESVLGQTFKNFELLICDDGSSDNTVKIVNSYHDSRIHLIQNKKNIGPGKSRDRLISQARGQWITLLDADDVYTCERLEVLYEIAKKNPNFLIFDELMECHDTENGLVPHKPIRPLPVDSHSLADTKLSFYEWITWNRTTIQLFVHIDLIKNNNIKHGDGLFGEDLEFVLNIIGKNKVPLLYVPKAMYLYRISSGSLTARPDRFDQLRGVYERSKSLFVDDPLAINGLNDKIQKVHKAQVYQVFFSYFMHGKLLKAFWQALQHPWIFYAFIKRSISRIPYHLKRLRYRAKRRETV